MYRLHDFECKACGYTREELCDVSPGLMSIQCRKCGALMEHVLMGGKAHTFKPFMHEHLDHKPVYITGFRQYKEELKKRGLANELAS